MRKKHRQVLAKLCESEALTRFGFFVLVADHDPCSCNKTSLLQFIGLFWLAELYDGVRLFTSVKLKIPESTRELKVEFNQGRSFSEVFLTESTKEYKVEFNDSGCSVEIPEPESTKEFKGEFN